MNTKAKVKKQNATRLNKAEGHTPLKRSVTGGEILDSDRDKKTGRFLKGNKASPGNPIFAKIHEYRKAISDAVTPEYLREVLRKLIQLALMGDTVAARILLDRTVGNSTAPTPDKEAIAVKLPPVHNARDLVKATAAITKALTAGTLSPDDAVKLSTVLELSRRAMETSELASRLDRLEEEAGE